MLKKLECSTKVWFDFFQKFFEKHRKPDRNVNLDLIPVVTGIMV